MGHFLGFFEGADLLDSKIVLCYAQDSLGVKKVSAPSKKIPRNAPLYVFAAKKIISRTFRISGTLIVKTALNIIIIAGLRRRLNHFYQMQDKSRFI
jgi:hypothetical protein